MQFYWNPDTIEYFKRLNSKPGLEGEYIRQLSDFVKFECTLEDGETSEMLIKDLTEKTK